MRDLITPDELPRWVPGESTTDSAALGWDGVRVRDWRYKALDVPIPAMRDYMIVVYNQGDTLMNRRAIGDWRKEAVNPGAVSLLTHAADSHWRWSEPLSVTHLYLCPEPMAAIAAEAYERPIKDVELRDILRTEDPVLCGIAASLYQEARQTGLGCRLYVDALRAQACVHILRRYANVIFREPTRSGGLSVGQRRLLDQYIAENLDRALSLEELAGVVQISAFHFSRKVRAEYGKPPHAYLLEKRIERAKAQLARRDIPIKAVAANSGFADQSHMTRIFRRAVGVTPAAFRRAQLG